MKQAIVILLAAASLALSASAFEGRIEAVFSQGTESTSLSYTVGATQLRIEVTGSTAPTPVDILDLKSGAMTLLFPHNRSFVRLKPATEKPAIPGFPAMPMPPGGLPPGIGPQSNAAPAAAATPQAPPNIEPQSGLPGGAPATPAMPALPAMPPGIGPQSSTSPGMPAAMPAGAAGMPPMPPMPPMPTGIAMMDKLELKPTGKKEEILGFACEQYEVKQRGETLEIWATGQLLPYEPYLRNPPPRFGPRMLGEQWPKLVKEQKLFPLRAILRYDNGTERFRFEVKSVKAEKLKPEDAKLFEPPGNYIETEPLPF